MNNNYLQAIRASIEAGKEILKVYNTEDFQVEKKGDDSPLTLADKNAHLKIMEYLDVTNIPVLSEEGKEIPYLQRKDWDELWIVDPLDGTKEFIKRNDEFTVNIALIEKQKPKFGVIYAPVTKELYFGISGKGAYKIIWNEKMLIESLSIEDLMKSGDSLPLKFQRPFTVVASRSHLSDETKEYIEELRQDHPDLEFISKGSSLKLCAVAEGAADVYPRFAPTMEWDTAAGQAIVESMGGKVIKVDKTPLNYNREDLLNPWFIVCK